MGIADGVAPVQKVTFDEMVQGFIDQFAKVSWGTPDAEAGDMIGVVLQLQNAVDDDLVAVERIRLTCTPTATMTIKAAGNGTILAGDGTADMIIETDAVTGSFDLEVTDVGVGVITVVGGATQGSGHVSCRTSVDLTFA